MITTRMTENKIWSYCLDTKVAFARPFDRDFIWISREDFQQVRGHFVKEMNFLHSGDSFRSNGYLSHIHAVDQGDVVFIHYDTGNLAKFLPLGLVHLVVDVIPYIGYAWIKGVPLNSVFKYPTAQ